MADKKISFHLVNNRLGFTVQSDDPQEIEELLVRAEELMADRQEEEPEMVDPVEAFEKGLNEGFEDGSTPFEVDESIPFEDDQVAQQQAQPTGQPSAEGVPQCQKCQGPMWDNREGKTNPRGPDFKCKDTSCIDAKGYVTASWLPKE